LAGLQHFRGSIAQQFAFDDFLGGVGIQDGTDFGSSDVITDVDPHGHTVGGSERLGCGSHKGGECEGANDLHLEILFDNNNIIILYMYIGKMSVSKSRKGMLVDIVILDDGYSGAQHQVRRSSFVARSDGWTTQRVSDDDV
jgi:hypothetical protein